jgi:ATP-dependent Clp protease ATP-binding subunit ClpA
VFERFTAAARQAVLFAPEEARLLNHGYVGSEHVLLGLLRVEEGVAARALKSVGVTHERVRGHLVRVAGTREGGNSDQLPFTPRAKMVVELALREALAFSDGHIATAHILLALTRVNDGTATRVLFDLGADPQHVGGEVLDLRSGRTWEEGGWEESPEPGSRAARTWPPEPLRATAVRAAVEVALLAAAAKARDEDRPVDLGDLLLALTEGWPGDLVARPLSGLGIDEHRLDEAVKAARRRGD